jgi:mRNA-degrading endonuclease toxin of MazEF toxin-antitoxin module
MGAGEPILMNPGEIYWADLATGRRPIIVVSREDLNRGSYVVAVLCTTADVATRSQLPNCVPFTAGEFGLPRDCVAQCEAITFVEQQDIDVASGIVGTLDALRLRDVIRAIGHVLEADCEPS